VGSSFAVLVAEQLFTAGCELLLSITSSGQIVSQGEPPYFVLIELDVIRYYRARWRTEDWHKALKTGCKIEDRQLETWERMEVPLSICSVIA
jgi:hypothetical protein